MRFDWSSHRTRLKIRFETIMQLGSWFKRGREVNRTSAWICLLVNQLVTPGLGSLAGGRLYSGVLELVIAFVGFGFVMAWYYHLFQLIVRAEDIDTGLRPYGWLGKLGLLLFGVAWILALISSIQILRRSVRVEKRRPPPLRR